MSVIENIKSLGNLYFSKETIKETKTDKTNKLFNSSIKNQKHNRTNIKIDDPSVTHYPGLSEVINAPITSIKSAFDFVKAMKKNDLEGKIDSQLQFHRSNLSFSYALLNGLTKICSIAFFDIPSIYYYIASTIIPFVGLLLCTVEAVAEGFGLRRGVQLLTAIHNDLIETISSLAKKRLNSKKIEIIRKSVSKLKDSGVSRNKIKKLTNHLKDSLTTENKLKIRSDLQTIKRKLIEKDLYFIFRKYFTLNRKERKKISENINSKYKDENIKKQKIKKLTQDSLAVKKANLARRVRPHVADKLERTAPLILSHLKIDKDAKTNRPWLKQGEKTIKLVDIQCQKRVLIHAIGIIALALTIIGFSLAIAGCPYVAVAIFLTIGGLLALERSVLSRVLLDSKGWCFEWYRLSPQWALPYFQKIERIFRKPPEQNTPCFVKSKTFHLPKQTHERASRHKKKKR